MSIRAGLILEARRTSAPARVNGAADAESGGCWRGDGDVGAPLHPWQLARMSTSPRQSPWPCRRPKRSRGRCLRTASSL